MFRRALLPSLLAAGAILLVPAVPALAQHQSEGAKFLEAVRSAKAEDVTRMVETPGSRIVDTRDYSTGEGALHIVVRRGDSAYLSPICSATAPTPICATTRAPARCCSRRRWGRRA